MRLGSVTEKIYYLREGGELKNYSLTNTPYNLKEGRQL